MESLLQAIEHADPLWAYILLFLSAFLENIFPPIPGDTVTVFGAYLVGREVLNFWGVYISTTTGSVLGFMGIYGLAFWLEWKVIEKYRPKWISRTRIDKVEEWFQVHGYWVILFNRFFSGVRSIISLVAGLSKLQTIRVFVLALISCGLWNAGLIYMGRIIGKNWQVILDFLKVYNRIVIILILGAIFLYLIYGKYRKN